MLGKEGYRVLFAASGEEGLRIAREEQPDVITLDVLMAGLDGWGTLSRLKADAATADIPVVVVTVLDDRNLGFALGAADYLTKPIERERLADALRRVRADERAGPALVVDDDPGVREMLRRILEKDGWRVVEAENGRVALDCMLESGPSVVLLDLMMPEMDGFTFIDEVRRRGGVGSAPIIVLTAKTLTETDRQRLQGAVTRVLQKGEQSSSELIAEIRRVMQTTRRPAPAGGS
jgi:CheY-like chemotaxis protein